MKEEFIDSCSIRKSILLLFGGMIIVSILFCVFLSINHALPIHSIEEYFYVGDEYKNLNYFITVFIKYFKKYMIIYIVGSISVLLPLSILIFCVETFSYGFCITYFYILFGGLGLRKAIGSFGVQSLMLELLLIWIISRLIGAKETEKREIKDRVVEWIVGVTVCLLMAFYEVMAC